MPDAARRYVSTRALKHPTTLLQPEGISSAIWAMEGMMLTGKQSWELCLLLISV